MIKIADLQAGDEVLGWMRLGLAITTGQRGDGSVYLVVPDKPQKAKSSDLSRFIGQVVANDPDEKVITIRATKVDTAKIGFNRDRTPRAVSIHYSALRRLRKISAISYEPRQDNTTFPANFEDVKFKAYRTVEEVKL